MKPYATATTEAHDESFSGEESALEPTRSLEAPVEGVLPGEDVTVVDDQLAIEFLLDKLRQTKTNQEFFESMKN